MDFNAFGDDMYEDAWRLFKKADLERCIELSKHAYWTLEVFHNDVILIPEEQVVCKREPCLTQQMDSLHDLKRESVYKMYHRQVWNPVTVTYSAYGDNVGNMLVKDWEELAMVHHATAELTYWLGVDTPDRTWTMKNWMVTGCNMTDTGSSISEVNLTFLFSDASLTRY